MINVRNTTVQEDTVEWAGQSVTLVGAVTAAEVETPWFTFGATYRRPARVEVGGETAGQAVIKDHVMLARLTVLALTLLAVTRRLFR